MKLSEEVRTAFHFASTESWVLELVQRWLRLSSSSSGLHCWPYLAKLVMLKAQWQLKLNQKSYKVKMVLWVELNFSTRANCEVVCGNDEDGRPDRRAHGLVFLRVDRVRDLLHLEVGRWCWQDHARQSWQRRRRSPERGQNGAGAYARHSHGKIQTDLRLDKVSSGSSPFSSPPRRWPIPMACGRKPGRTRSRRSTAPIAPKETVATTSGTTAGSPSTRSPRPRTRTTSFSTMISKMKCSTAVNQSILPITTTFSAFKTGNSNYCGQAESRWIMMVALISWFQGDSPSHSWAWGGVAVSLLGQVQKQKGNWHWYYRAQAQKVQTGQAQVRWIVQPHWQLLED